MKSLSRVRLFATPWIVGAYHVSLSMGFSRQEYWSGLQFPSPEDLPNPGIKYHLLCLLHRRQILYLLSRWECAAYALPLEPLEMCSKISSRHEKASNKNYFNITIIGQ